VRVVPRQRTKEDLADAPGRLLATMISVAAAGMLDATRFRRGREYARSGAVTALDIEPGSLHGTVQGSRREPYEVTVRTATVPPPPGTAPAMMAVIAPNAADLWAECSCPDGDTGTCKHVVAVLLSFADEVALRPELLSAWRAPAGASPSRAEVGSRRPGPGVATVSSLPSRPMVAPPPSPFETDEWREFTAAPPGAADLDPVLDAIRAAPPLTLGTERLGAVDLSSMLRSALQSMRAAGGDLF